MGASDAKIGFFSTSARTSKGFERLDVSAFSPLSKTCFGTHFQLPKTRAVVMSIRPAVATGQWSRRNWMHWPTNSLMFHSVVLSHCTPWDRHRQIPVSTKTDWIRCVEVDLYSGKQLHNILIYCKRPPTEFKGEHLVWGHWGDPQNFSVLCMNQQNLAQIYQNATMLYKNRLTWVSTRLLMVTEGQTMCNVLLQGGVSITYRFRQDSWLGKGNRSACVRPRGRLRFVLTQLRRLHRHKYSVMTVLTREVCLDCGSCATQLVMLLYLCITRISPCWWSLLSSTLLALGNDHSRDVLHWW